MAYIKESRKKDWHFLPPSLRSGKPINRKTKVKVERVLLQIRELIKFKTTNPANVIARPPIRTFELQQLSSLPPKAYLEVEQVKTRLDPEPFYYVDSFSLCDKYGDLLEILDPEDVEMPEQPKFEASPKMPADQADTLISCANLALREHIIFRANPRVQNYLDLAASIARLAINMQRSPEQALATYFATIANAFSRMGEQPVKRSRPRHSSDLLVDAIPKKGIYVQRRQYEPGRFTNDIYVDGKLYTPAVGDSILKWVLKGIETNRKNQRKLKNKTK